MPYYPHTPAAGSRVNATRQPIQENFEAIQSALGRNHITFTNANEDKWGKHAFVGLERQDATPPLQSAHDLNIFSRQFATRPELFLKRDGVDATPFCAHNTPYREGIAGKNWVYLSDHLVLCYGQVTSPAGTTRSINYDAPSPYTQIPHVVASMGGANTGEIPRNHLRISAELTNFRAYFDNTDNATFTWFALGPV